MMTSIDTGPNTAAGETGFTSESYSPSPLMFWLKTRIDASSTRVRYSSPNTLLGLIPLGSDTQTIPLHNIASVDTSVKFNMGSFLIGLILALAGVSMLGSSVGLGLILLAFGIVNLLNTMSARLDFVNNSGGRNSITVSILEKAKLMAMAGRIEQLVFADQDALRHADSMRMAQQSFTVQSQQALLQQQMLDAQRAANAAQTSTTSVDAATPTVEPTGM